MCIKKHHTTLPTKNTHCLQAPLLSPAVTQSKWLQSNQPKHSQSTATTIHGRVILSHQSHTCLTNQPHKSGLPDDHKKCTARSHKDGGPCLEAGLSGGPCLEVCLLLKISSSNTRSCSNLSKHDKNTLTSAMGKHCPVNVSLPPMCSHATVPQPCHWLAKQDNFQHFPVKDSTFIVAAADQQCAQNCGMLLTFLHAPMQMHLLLLFTNSPPTTKCGFMQIHACRFTWIHLDSCCSMLHVSLISDSFFLISKLCHTDCCCCCH